MKKYHCSLEAESELELLMEGENPTDALLKFLEHVHREDIQLTARVRPLQGEARNMVKVSWLVIDKADDKGGFPYTFDVYPPGWNRADGKPRDLGSILIDADEYAKERKEMLED